MSGLTRLVEALETSGSKGRGKSWQCPAHEDRAPSLSIDQGTKGAVLECKAGCQTTDVLAAIGLTMADLFDEPLAPRERPRVVATYPYCDENGELLYTVRRIEPGYDGDRKTFRPYRPNGTAGIKGIRRVLYRLPEVLDAARAGGTILVVEGEKDADNLAARGVVATCNLGGVGGGWRDEYTSAFRGASEVVVIADRDEPGYKHAAAVAESVKRAGIPVRVMQPAKGKDVTDHLAAGLGYGDLLPLDVEQDQDDEDTSPQPEEWPEEIPANGGPDPAVAERLDFLRSQLLTTHQLDAIPPPEPLISETLYRDSLAWIQGKPGNGKSFVALDWAGCIANGFPWQGNEITNPGRVLYLIAEGASGLQDRVRAWEAMTGHSMDHVMFLPVAIQLLNPVDVESFALLAAEIEAVLVVIDTQARVTVGMEENSAKDMGLLVDAADRIRVASRACVAMVHHEGRGGEHLRGSSAMEGAATTIVRVSKDGLSVRLDCVKQKDGAEFPPVVLQMVEYANSVALQAPGAVRRAPSGAEVTILQTMREAFDISGASTTVLMETSGVPKASFYRALNTLVKDRKLLKTGTKARPIYVLPDVPEGEE